MRRVALPFLVLTLALGASRGRPATAEDSPAPRWVLDVAPAKTVVAVLECEVPTPPSGPLTVLAPVPPTTDGQRVLDATFRPDATTVADTLGGNSMFCAVWKAAPKTKDRPKRIPVVWQVRVELHTRRLRALDDGETAPAGKPRVLDAADRKRCTSPTSRHDFLAPSFIEWTKARSLGRTKGERDLDFARRAFLEIRRSTTYSYPPPSIDRIATHVCRDGTSDCSGLNSLFVALLRSQGVPARVLVGRWATSTVADGTLRGVPYRQTHVKAEFWADGLGWVPVDAGLDIPYTSDEAALANFGQDAGDFVVFHSGSDLRVEVPTRPGTPIDLLGLQQPWAFPLPSGDRTFDEAAWSVFERR